MPTWNSLILSCLFAVLAMDASAGPGSAHVRRDTLEACGTRSGLALVYVCGGPLEPERGGDGAAVRTVPDFLIGKYEVTQADWQEVLGLRPSQLGGCAECPVEQVSWQDVQRFLGALNRRTGRGYRLPLEDEWEYAARGGGVPAAFEFAEAAAPVDIAWHAANARGRPRRVGSLRPNPLGLYDMSGNVDEWCALEGAAPADAGILHRGAWGDDGDRVLIAVRESCAPDRRLPTAGLRLAQSIERSRAHEPVRLSFAAPGPSPAGAERAPRGARPHDALPGGDR